MKKIMYKHIDSKKIWFLRKSKKIFVFTILVISIPKQVTRAET